MEPESPRDGRALREMARLANSPASRAPGSNPRRPNADSSGLVDLAALMAEQPNWLDSALARAKASAGTSLAPPSFSPASLAPTMSEVADDDVSVPRGRSLPIVLAATGAGLLVAAACVFALRTSAPHATVTPPAPPVAAIAHAAGPEAPAIATAAVAAVTPPVETGAAQVTTAPSSPPPSAAPRVVESEGPPVGRHWRHGRHERIAEARVAPAAAKVADAPSPPPPVHQTAAPAAPPPPAPHAGSALDAALRAAAGGGGALPATPAPDPTPAAAAPKAAPPPAATDGRPERPSGSAVTSALTEVLTQARKCVAGMTNPSRALITFGPDGAVHKVDVTGPAGSDGKATQCLRTAFNRAHVPPFSSSSYAAGVTVRPQ